MQQFYAYCKRNDGKSLNRKESIGKEKNHSWKANHQARLKKKNQKANDSYNEQKGKSRNVEENIKNQNIEKKIKKCRFA